jgi:hypothetical protein
VRAECRDKKTTKTSNYTVNMFNNIVKERLRRSDSVSRQLSSFLTTGSGLPETRYDGGAV